MKCLLILTATLSLAAGSPLSLEPEPRIIGGYEARPHSIPHQASLLINTTGGALLCGGSLIAKDWVLTAAHCVDKAIKVNVALGVHDIKHAEPEKVIIPVSSSNVIVHPGWKPIKNDIALIRLPKPVELNENIQTVNLPSREEVASGETYAGELATLSGWGQVSDNKGDSPSRLREVQLPILTHDKCNSFFLGLSGEHICVSGAGKKGACKGDSGGPLTVKNKAGKLIQVGIASFVGPQGCVAGWPTVYTRITFYMDWIMANTGLSFT